MRMVQIKPPSNSKLGFQAADHHQSLVVQPSKSQTRIYITAGGIGEGSLEASLFPSSHRLIPGYDTRNRRLNLLKKMKQSRSRMLDTLGAPSSLAKLKDFSHPCNPPDVPPSSSLQTPPKHSPIKPLHNGSPNYMKSTSSFEARKERNQARPRKNLFASDAAKIQSHLHKPKHLKNSSSTKSSSSSSASLRPVRTLTKTPGLKPARSSVTRCSQAALCTDINAQRATCSSTLKDTKFPSYLMLSPGGTESQGTSTVKVCPYTYCSLNGHCHNPVSPLKCFLSARRRLSKTQKNMIKCEAPSPRSVKKPVDQELKDKHTKENLFPDKLSDGEDDSSINSAISREGWANFFIEIYGKDKEDSGHYGAFPQDIEEVDESVSDGSPQSEIDSQEQPEDKNFGYFTMLVAANTLFEEQNEQSDAPFSEASDIEWEEGVFPSLGSDIDQGDKSQSNSEADSSNKPETPITSSYNESDETVRSGLDEILSPERLYGDFQDEFGSRNEVEVLYLNSEGYESSPEADSQINEQRPFFGDASELLETEQDNHATALRDASPMFDPASLECQNGKIEESSEENITVYHPYSEIVYEKVENEVQADPENEDLITPQVICSNNHATGAIQDVNDEDNINDSVQEDATTGSCREFEEEGIPFETQCRASNEQFHLHDRETEESYSKNGRCIVDNSRNVEEQIVGDISKCTSVEDAASDVDRTGGHDGRFDAAVACYNVNHVAMSDAGNVSINAKLNGNQEAAATCNDLKGRMRCPRPVKETEDPRGFNPRGPNYLPVEPSPDTEKVDLKHQMMDERKNAEEWMTDYALQRTVTKLAPAQKRKVALLVEAFETVVPIPKPATSRVRHGSVAFAHVRPIQACS